MKRRQRDWLQVKLAAIVFVVVVGLARDLRGADMYPQVRAIVYEAETNSTGIQFLPDRSEPLLVAGRLYMRAGYLDDAARVFGSLSDDRYHLWKFRAVYGDLDGADKTLESIGDPQKKAQDQIQLADLLWKLGEPGEAKRRFDAARQTASRIANPEQRDRLTEAVENGLKQLNEEPPYRLTATPKPTKNSEMGESTIPSFPVTTDGFVDVDSKERASIANADAEMMTRLYARMAAHDREGLLLVVETAKTPFQKAVALASIEHILIQANHPHEAEQYASQMPELDAPSLLAKAEALTAVGLAWSRAGNAERARVDFDSAANLVRSVKDVPLGKISVTVSIAKAQYRSGIAASGNETLKTAEEWAEGLPVRPPFVKGQVHTTSPAVHYRDEAYPKILTAAVRVHNIALAHEIANRWKATADSAANAAIVRAWLEAGQNEEAIAFARGIGDKSARIQTLLIIATDMLNYANAPTLF